MSDNKKVYSKVLRTLKKRMKGLPERHVVIWAMMVAGIVLSKKGRLSANPYLFGFTETLAHSL